MKSLGAIVLAAILAAAIGATALAGAVAGEDPGRNCGRAQMADPSTTDRRSVYPASGPPFPRLPGA